MKLLRNPEIRKSFLLLALLCLTATLVAAIWDALFGIFTFAISAVLLVVFLLVEEYRYKRIADLSQGINKVLHGDDSIDFQTYTEGELAILQSEIHKMTVRLREQQQNLEKEKMYLADSIADISHQIRTPLTSINLIVTFLSEPDLSTEKRQELMRELYGMLSRIDWLVITLMKISKLDAGTVQFKRETVTLENLISKAASTLLVPMELRGQALSVKAEGSFEGDLSWTSEALGNIIKNCMEHTPEGGRIEITARETPVYSEVVILDNGTGIAPEDLPNIFKRFYKGKDSGDKGFGIGLALARMIITAQNGTVKAENVPAGGARFTIRFYKGAV